MTKTELVSALAEKAEVSKKDAEKAKDHAEVDTFKELGEETFNYYMRQEGLAK